MRLSSFGRAIATTASVDAAYGCGEGEIMADTRSGMRDSVPIALGSASSGTEEGREFFQARLALFGGWIALISGSFYIAYVLLTRWMGQHIEAASVPIGDPNLYHLAATLVAG